jgi:hypothetical protein
VLAEVIERCVPEVEDAAAVFGERVLPSVGLCAQG